MSLYSLDEICKDCVHARWVNGVKRTAFDYCNIDVEDNVDGVRGYCKSKRTSKPKGNDASLREG